MKKNKAIPVKILAKIIDVHRATIGAWLCHYSLNKYQYDAISDSGKLEKMFQISDKSIKALRAYLSKKRVKYLAYFDAKFNDYM